MRALKAKTVLYQDVKIRTEQNDEIVVKKDKYNEDVNDADKNGNLVGEPDSAME